MADNLTVMISIVVPVYNAVRWVKACVASIACQKGFEELREVLLVDDGSTDASGDMCRQLAAKYGNVHCLSEPNSGPATARNLGMSHARGEYVWFVDADDQIAPNALRALADCIERNGPPTWCASTTAMCMRPATKMLWTSNTNWWWSRPSTWWHRAPSCMHGTAYTAQRP